MRCFSDVLKKTLPPDVFGDVLEKVNHRTNDASNDVSRPALVCWGVNFKYQAPVVCWHAPGDVLRMFGVKNTPTTLHAVIVDFCREGVKILANWFGAVGEEKKCLYML